MSNVWELQSGGGGSTTRQRRSERMASLNVSLALPAATPPSHTRGAELNCPVHGKVWVTYKEGETPSCPRCK